MSCVASYSMNRLQPIRKDRDMREFYLPIHERLIVDVAESYVSPAAKQESRRDIAVMRHRVSEEGISFLTKCLPKLAKELDRALSQGTKFAPRGFVTKPRSTIPKFLGWLFELVFASDGSELSNSDPRAVRDLRQILYFLYKLEVPYTSDQEVKLLDSFKHTDSGLPDQIADDTVLLHARNFISSVFGSFDPSDIVPKHGPGAVATGEKNHEKHRFSRLYSAIERVYPFTEYYVYSLDHLVVEPEYLARLQVFEAGTAKVVLVPKDSRGPRIISCEPLEYQWIQGGLGGAIKSHLEVHPLTRGHVNFTDQTINGHFALEGSKGKPWVTLDMKEASDRVSCALVAKLFGSLSPLLDALMATRTPCTRLPNGDVVTMKKFAPMGSNLCFPIESIVFMALGVGVLVDAWLKAHPLSVFPHQQARVYSDLLRRMSRRLFVYGDDIIARREDYALLLEYFPKVGLMFNTDKCCTQGSFRESCGVDAYKGINVTPLRLKRLWMYGRNSQTPETYCSYTAFSNAAYERGLHRVASLVSEAVEHDLGPLPVLPERPKLDSHCPTERYIVKSNPDDYGAICWVRPYSCVRSSTRPKHLRFNSDLQRREVRLLQAVPQRIVVDSDDWSMVLRRFSSPSVRSAPGAFTLTRRVTLKRVWLSY